MCESASRITSLPAGACTISAIKLAMWPLIASMAAGLPIAAAAIASKRLTVGSAS